MAKTETNAPLIERILAFAILVTIAAAVISFVAVLIASANGIERDDFTQGIWPFVTWVSYVGLPIGLVLILTLLVMNMRRRARENKQA
jgi:TRAP-type C4-dicarboxylate transport system permease small subunit